MLFERTLLYSPRLNKIYCKNCNILQFNSSVVEKLTPWDENGEVLFQVHFQEEVAWE